MTKNQPKPTLRFTRRRRAVAALALAIGLLAAACGSDDDAETTNTADTTEQPAGQSPTEPAVSDDTMEDGEMDDGEMDDDTMDDEEMTDGEMTDGEMTDGEMTDDTMDDEEMDDQEMTDGEMIEPSAGWELGFVGLEPLANGVHYEGWIIVDGQPVSTGRFNVDDAGALTDLDGTPIDGPFATDHATDATAVVISIEPADDPDPAPAEAKILAGDVVDGRATLTTAHPAALGTDFSEAAGVYLLGTPTTDALDDELSGVWFIGLNGGAVQGLDLPVLPAGWEYEGWAVIDGTPVSTGRFIDPAQADDFDDFSGPSGGPDFPGEDFITNAPDGLTFPTDLRDAAVVISVEPADDDSEAPFALKPLFSDVPDAIGDHEVQTLGAGPASPTGEATLTHGA